MQRADFSQAQCSVARTLDIIGDPWTPLVLRDVAIGVSRFDAIQRNLGVSRKVLAQRLRALADHGIVTRTAYQDNPPRHDYSLTERGRDLAMVLLAIQAYSDKWVFGEGTHPVSWKHLSCGELSAPVLSCDHCGEQLRPGEIAPMAGPGFDEVAFPETAQAFIRIQQLLSGVSSQPTATT